MEVEVALEAELTALSQPLFEEVCMCFFLLLVYSLPSLSFPVGFMLTPAFVGEQDCSNRTHPRTKTKDELKEARLEKESSAAHLAYSRANAALLPPQAHSPPLTLQSHCATSHSGGSLEIPIKLAPLSSRTGGIAPSFLSPALSISLSTAESHTQSSEAGPPPAGTDNTLQRQPPPLPLNNLL